MRPPQQKPGDTDLAGAALAPRPLHGGVEIRHHLRVRHPARRCPRISSCMSVTVAGLPCRANNSGATAECAVPGEAVADVADGAPRHAEDFLDHQHHRQPLRPVAGRAK
jgi:hypothetical protein